MPFPAATGRPLYFHALQVGRWSVSNCSLDMQIMNRNSVFVKSFWIEVPIYFGDARFVMPVHPGVGLDLPTAQRAGPEKPFPAGRLATSFCYAP